MDPKEITLRGHALAKAAQGGDPPTTLLDILSELRTGVHATEDLLRSTKIGVTVNRLNKHKDPRVQRLAIELVHKWRNDVGKAKGHGGSSPAGAKSATTPVGAAVPSPVKQEKMANGGDKSASPAKRKSSVPPDKRSAKADGVDWKLTGNSIRDNCLMLMYDGLAIMSDEAPESVLTIARSVEAAAHAVYGPETSEPYKSKMRSLYQNLKSKTNPALRASVLNGSIPAARFVVMKDDELKSKERKAEDRRMQKENLDKAMVAQEEKSISTALTCGKCGQKKVSYSQAQTRSADEPMTTFCECTVCGNRWKFS